MQIQVEQFETETAPESLLLALHDHYLSIESEDLPDDPPTPIEMRLAEWRHPHPQHVVRRWALLEDDRIVASALAAYDIHQNLENGFARINVHPDQRGRGLGRALATPVLDHLEERGRWRVETWVRVGAPEEELLRALGMKSVYGERRSRLRVADLDRRLMKAWIHRAAERGSDYELIYRPSPMPDSLVVPFCELTSVMNTAPREEFVEEDETLTPDQWREIEVRARAARCLMHNLIAVHKPTGDLVGYTQLRTQELQPDLAWQWDTGVDPAHRGRGLGRWLKAEMILRIVDRYPAVARVDTFNAGSNEPMLNINIAMGFRPLLLTSAWQGELAKVRARLGA